MKSKEIQIPKLSKGCCKVLNAALGKEVGQQLIRQINIWLKGSGTEWTCKRLKSLRTGIYQLRAGHPEIAKAIWQENSIAYSKTNMLPKGIFHYIAKNYLKAQRPVVIRKYDLVLRVYTSLKLDNLSDSQLQKCKKAINTPYLGDDNFLFRMCRRIAQETDKLGFSRVKPPKPDLSRMKRWSKTHMSFTPSTDVLKMPWGSHITSLWTSVYLPDTLSQINPAERLRCELVKSGADSTTCGHIAFIQENGCKARVVAVPNVWIQLMLKPLEDVLSELIKTLPESCRNDQVNGAFFIEANFKKGNTLWCYDLSSATDRFPLPLQEVVLNHLGYGNYAKAIRDIANGQWHVSIKTGRKFTEEVWSYKTGQPMGMYCSFALFHLTHILLLRSIESEVGVSGTFTVLGDDVIISHPQVAQLYSEAMQRLNVDVSDTKTVISEKLAEYAGFVGYKLNNGKCTMHRPFKFSGQNKMGYSLHLMNALGQRSKLINQWFDKSYELFKFTMSDRLPDLSPIVTSNDDAYIGQRLNSHLLGAISNRLSYELPFEVTDELLSMYELQQIILLGEKEIVVNGFASKDNNLQMFTPRDLSELSNKDNNEIFSYHVQFTNDPLVRNQIAIAKETTLNTVM